MAKYTVDSSMIKEMDYNEETQILQVTFNGGGIYEYANVPLEKVQTVVASPSVGKAFNTQIKNSYSFRKIR